MTLEVHSVLFWLSPCRKYFTIIRVCQCYQLLSLSNQTIHFALSLLIHLANHCAKSSQMVHLNNISRWASRSSSPSTIQCPFTSSQVTVALTLVPSLAPQGDHFSHSGKHHFGFLGFPNMYRVYSWTSACCMYIFSRPEDSWHHLLRQDLNAFATSLLAINKDSEIKGWNRHSTLPKL